MKPIKHEPLNITRPDQSLTASLQDKIDQKTKPLGALGQLEKIALQVGLIQQSLTPVLTRPVVMVFAGDHGVVAEGVSPFPQSVTQQMVMNFLAGGAAVNVFARQLQMQVKVVDAGVNHVFEPHPDLISAKIGMGTRNFVEAEAMTSTQCATALQQGARLVETEIAAGTNILAFGEMGIGNTTAAAAIMAALCTLPPSYCAGRGTGLDDAGVQHKIAVIEQALQRHASAQSPTEILACLGGFEIAMMTGAMLAAAEAGAVLLIDGFIATVALLVASRLQPEILHYCIFSHCSDEAGHAMLLKQLDAKPVLNLGMRLGEGTGAVMAYPLVQAAVNFMNEMASFESAHVSGKVI